MADLPNPHLISALGKLGITFDKYQSHADFQALPATRDGPHWDKLQKKPFKLSYFEVTALKNARCGDPSPQHTQPVDYVQLLSETFFGKVMKVTIEETFTSCLNKYFSSKVSREASNLPSTWANDVFHIAHLQLVNLKHEKFNTFFEYFSKPVYDFLLHCYKSLDKNEETVQNYMNGMMDSIIQANLFQGGKSVSAVKNKHRLLKSIIPQVQVEEKSFGISGVFDVEVSGYPDGTFVYANIGLASIVLKSQTMEFRDSPFQSASCQLSFFMQAEMALLDKIFHIQPKYYFGFLTNGLQWCLFRCERVDFKYVIHRSSTIIFPSDYFEKSAPLSEIRKSKEFRKIMILLYTCIENGKSIFSLVENLYVDKGFDDTKSDEKERDDELDDNGNDTSDQDQSGKMNQSSTTQNSTRDYLNASKSNGKQYGEIRKPIGVLSESNLNTYNNLNTSPLTRLMNKLNNRRNCISVSIEELLDIENN